MDRQVLLEHIRKTRFASDGGERARSDARRIGEFLLTQGAERVVGFGSAFLPEKRFTARSDLDLAVGGLRPDRFFSVFARAQAMTDFRLDLVPIEAASEFLQRTIREEGVPLWPPRRGSPGA